ncbi:flippase-like domain-containing protein [Tissierella carlieri]|uniref:Phosphatidylglycerol lysyltransferase n=1 Tax=Tissierella carlieri TaxID=689904 RepID=A0ABT1SAB2_9FIRM|nr:flippase-like domain-containing protein [Tissierella carlieri]MCQ4923426.1 flippase-like domain-containing protein [Tissierella carlieri]
MKKALNYIILIGLIGLTIWIFVSNNDFDNFSELISSANTVFLLIAVLCMVLYWFFEAYIIHRMKKTLNIKSTYGSSLKLCMIGQYYSAITPFSTGGQPVQIYSLVSDGVPVGTASSLFVNRFLIYQLVVTFYSLFMFIIRFNLLYTEAKLALPFVIIGCLVNFIILIMIFGFLLNEKFIRNLLSKSIRILHKFKIIKDIEKSEEKMNNTLLDYKTSVEEMKRDKRTTLELILVSIVQLTIGFSITFFVYLALGFEMGHFLDIIAIQSLHYMAVSFMPTPGTAGAAEGGFYMLFKVIFPKKILSFALILWRLIDYYLRVMIAGLVTLVDFIYRKKKVSIN